MICYNLQATMGPRGGNMDPGHLLQTSFFTDVTTPLIDHCLVMYMLHDLYELSQLKMA